jgi:hypothetical protein
VRRLLFLLGFRRENRRNLKPAIRLAWMSGAISNPRHQSYRLPK